MRFLNVTGWAAWLAVLAAATLAPAQETEERPTYTGKLYLTVVYSAPFEKTDAKLHRFLRKDPHMEVLVSRSNFTEWDMDDDIVKSTNWKKFLGESPPMLLVQGPHKDNGTGDVIFFATGQTLQLNDDFVKAIEKALEAYAGYVKAPREQRQPWRPFCPDGNCPRPNPRPNPQPTPDPVQPPGPPPVIQPIIPDIDIPLIDIDVNPEPEPEEEDSSSSIPLVALLAVIAAGAYGAFKGLS